MQDKIAPYFPTTYIQHAAAAAVELLPPPTKNTVRNPLMKPSLYYQDSVGCGCVI